MNIADKYFETFGQAQRPMAASIQSLLFCEQLIREQQLQTILDCGSGLSSAFFHSRFSNVLSIDDNPYWAGKTASFISSSIRKQINIEPIDTIQDRKFDFVFYDYGNIETRIYHFRKAFEVCNGFFYVDDMHVSYYRDYVQTRCRKHKLELLPETEDEYGRYGAIVLKQ